MYRSRSKYATIEDFKAATENNPVAQIHKKPTMAQFMPILSPIFSYQADLMFLDDYKAYNKKYSIILNLIDVNSKFLYSFPLTSKSQTYEIFEKWVPVHKIVQLTTDNGTEFVNNNMKKLMSKYGVDFVHTSIKTRTANVERVNRTIRGLIETHLSKTGGYEWLSALPQIVLNYNRTYHDSIKMAPIAITYDDVVMDRYNKFLQTISIITKIKKKYPIGAHVRIKINKDIFDKGARPNWTSTIYKIIKYIPKINFEVEELNKPENIQKVAYYNLLVIPDTTPVIIQEKKPSIPLIRKIKKIKQLEKNEDIKPENILETKRERKPIKKLNL